MKWRPTALWIIDVLIWLLILIALVAVGTWFAACRETVTIATPSPAAEYFCPSSLAWRYDHLVLPYSEQSEGIAENTFRLSLYPDSVALGLGRLSGNFVIVNGSDTTRRSLLVLWPFATLYRWQGERLLLDVSYSWLGSEWATTVRDGGGLHTTGTFETATERAIVDLAWVAC